MDRHVVAFISEAPIILLILASICRVESHFSPPGIPDIQKGSDVSLAKIKHARFAVSRQNTRLGLPPESACSWWWLVVTRDRFSIPAIRTPAQQEKWNQGPNLDKYKSSSKVSSFLFFDESKIQTFAKLDVSQTLFGPTSSSGHLESWIVRARDRVLTDLLSFICIFGLLLTFRLVSGACTLERGPPSDPANDRQDRDLLIDNINSGRWHQGMSDLGVSTSPV